MKMNVFPQRDIRHPKRPVQPALRTVNHTGCALCTTWIFPRQWRGETLETYTPEFLAQARLGGQPQPNKTRRDSGRAVYGAGEPLRLTALSRSHRPRRQREKYSRRNRHDAGRRG